MSLISWTKEWGFYMSKFDENKINNANKKQEYLIAKLSKKYHIKDNHIKCLIRLIYIPKEKRLMSLNNFYLLGMEEYHSLHHLLVNHLVTFLEHGILLLLE